MNLHLGLEVSHRVQVKHVEKEVRFYFAYLFSNGHRQSTVRLKTEMIEKK